MLSSIFDSVASGKKSEWLQLKQGVNQIKILTEPVAYRERYFKDLNKTEICYEGCGYAGKGVSTKFLCHAIDLEDPIDADGNTKAQLFKIGYQVMEALANKEKMRLAMKKPAFTFPTEGSFIILKAGEKLSTSYSVEYNDEASIAVDSSFIESLDSTESVLENWKKSTKERHEKEGSPVVTEEKEQLDVIQLDEFETPNKEKPPF